MKTDLYTKSVLTIIAFCLMIIVLKQINLFPNAFAGNSHVNLKANMGGYGFVPLNADGSIDVNIKSSSETVKVDVEEIGGFWINGATLPVTIK